MPSDRFKERVVFSSLKENSKTPSPTKQKTIAMLVAKTVEKTPTPRRKEKQPAEEGENKKASAVQTGIGPYITVKQKSRPPKITRNLKRVSIDSRHLVRKSRWAKARLKIILLK